ncbi:hypothetical protein FD755_024109 [Muntiacus reevesi]|uniref:Vomeronasal type-1 receptor n=1 Tax=Muntiacus reevesi TaxID=9886 RepID=A0A5N3VVK1_MUNRE|nr:hypothetical protein FD755_024109 [Muntiacus reevesi]
MLMSAANINSLLICSLGSDNNILIQFHEILDLGPRIELGPSATVVGILGKFSLLCSYIVLHFMGYRLRGPQTMEVFGWRHIRSDFGCKLLFFLHRVGRGVPIISICLLSVFQVITIGPWNSRWAALKVTAPKYVVLSIFLCWILQMLVNERDFGYCISVVTDKTDDAMYAALLLFPDVLCLGLKNWPGSSMVLILYRHKQQVQHICRTTASSRSSPESRGTKSILLLGSSFVYFYILSSICQALLAHFDQPSQFLVDITIIIAACFPTVSPSLLMSHNSSVHRLYFAWITNARSSTIMRKV